MTSVEVVSQTQTVLVDPEAQTIEVDSVTQAPIVINPPASSISVVNSGPQGPPGPQGDPGTSGAQYHHVQAIVSSVWNVEHNFGYKPSSIQVIDSGDNIVEGSIQHVDDNNLTLSFDSAFSGVANMI